MPYYKESKNNFGSSLLRCLQIAKYELIKEILAFVHSYISDCSDDGISTKQD